MTNATENPATNIRFVLPPMSADQVPAGRDAADYSVLQKIANGLTLAETLDEQAQQLISIPDVWAQVEVFRAALTEKAHPLHRRAVGEWRGLLAVFALRFSRAYDVTTQRVPLGGKGTGQGLIAILNKIKPAITLTSRHNWDEVGLIRVRGSVVGLLVPTTIVCPARRPPAALAGRLSWITQDRILDPLDVPDVNRDEIALLADFCARAAAQLQRNDEYAQDFAKRGLLSEIKGCFDDFTADAERRLGGGARARLSDRTLNLELPAQPLYALLRDVRVRGVEPGAEPLSQALLPTRPELQAAGINGILIIDPNLPHVLGAPASDINVWGGTKLQLVLDEREERQRIENEARAAGYLCLSPEDLFTTYFYRMDNVQIEAQPSGFKDALLPITPAVMMLLAPEDFPAAIELAPGHDEVTVTLRLKLSGTGGRGPGPVYTVRKTYDARDVINGAPPTTLSFWPDFEHPDWHWHFGYYGGRLILQFAPRMFVSMTAMAGFVAQADDSPAARVGRAIQLAKEPMREPQLLAERLFLEQTETPVELYRPNAAPEALYCDFVIDRRASGYVESAARTAAGILLLSRKKPTPSPDMCSIGVDFGTVNTSVYQRIGAGRPEPMRFNNHLLLPFATDSEETRAPYLDFLPLLDIGIPFLTVLRMRGLAAARLPVWSSFIYYVTDMNRGLQDLGTPRGLPLVFDLKWGTTLEELLPIRTFLAQVALQSLAEVVARGVAPRRVSWRFSYPEAYSPAQQADFADSAATAIRIATDPASGPAGLPLPGRRNPPPGLSTASESLSTALYFISEKPREAPAVGNLVTIDMGGLTSDVSIWHSLRLIWRNSLKLAGRHILLRYMLQNHDLIGRMAAVDPKIEPLVRQVEALPDAKRGNGIEMLMNSPLFQDAFVKDFHLVSGEPVGRRLRAVAELALLGILHYVGRTMQYCAAKSSAYQDAKGVHVSVCLGGRASMLYRALFDGARRAQLDASMGVFKDAAPGIIAGTQQVYSDIPKQEVAFGLLMREGVQNLEVQAEGYRVADIILGEAIQVGAKQLPYNSRTADLGVGPEWNAGNLDELKAFLGNVEARSQTITKVDLSADAERSILHAIDGQLVADRKMLQALAADGELNDAHLLSESTVIEPPFIVGLRELIDLVIEPESKAVRVQMRA